MSQYFCGVLPDPPDGSDLSMASYLNQRRDEVKRNAIDFLNGQVHHLWPNAMALTGRLGGHS